MGNVLVTVSDKKIPVLTGSGNSNISYYNADVVTANDYYPGGMTMPGRKFNQTNITYRYGFNGQEKDTELNQSITTAEFWEYDSRVVRRWNLDPVKRADESPYICFHSNPIVFSDPDGDDPITGIIEALTSFGLDVGLDFFTGYIIEGKSAGESFHDIGWISASWGAVKSYTVASFSPPGVSSGRKIAKLANSTAGKIVISVVEKMVTKAMDNFSKGTYNDEDKNFDFDKVSLKELFWESTIETLVEKGLGSMADEILNKLKRENKKLFEKVEKLKKKIEGDESAKRLKSYQKIVEKQKSVVKNETQKLLIARVTDKGMSSVISKSINQVRKKIIDNNQSDRNAKDQPKMPVRF